MLMVMGAGYQEDEEKQMEYIINRSGLIGNK